MGFEPVVAPLLAIRPIPQKAPDLSGIAALAFTSRNGVDAFAALSTDRSLPVFAVGDATAAAASAAGFLHVRSAAGALDDLSRLLASGTPGPVLAPGALEPAGDLAALLGGAPELRPLPVYEAFETRAQAPSGFDAVLVHSPRCGRALAALGPFPERIACVISGAAAAPLIDRSELEIRIAARPDETALLAALGNPARRV